LLIHVGSGEILLSDAVRLARCAALAEVSVQLRFWPRMPHTWQLFANMLEEGHHSIAEAGAFLDQHFGSYTKSG
jgi:acetyl esterase/lipase